MPKKIIAWNLHSEWDCVCVSVGNRLIDLLIWTKKKFIGGMDAVTVMRWLFVLFRQTQSERREKNKYLCEGNKIDDFLLNSHKKYGVILVEKSKKLFLTRWNQLHLWCFWGKWLKKSQEGAYNNACLISQILWTNRNNGSWWIKRQAPQSLYHCLDNSLKWRNSSEAKKNMWSVPAWKPFLGGDSLYDIMKRIPFFISLPLLCIFTWSSYYFLRQVPYVTVVSPLPR